jgi:hypothetical protein
MAQDWIENKLVSDIGDGLWGERLPQNLVVIWGFPAHSGRDDYDRLYLSLNFNEYIEFPHSGLVHVEDAGGPENPFSGAMIWLRRDTPVDHFHIQRLDLERTFLQGGIAGSVMGSAPNMAGNANAPAGPAAGGSTLVCTGGSTLVCAGGSTLVCTGGSTLVCTGGSTLVCTGAGGER